MSKLWAVAVVAVVVLAAGCAGGSSGGNAGENSGSSGSSVSPLESPPGSDSPGTVAAGESTTTTVTVVAGLRDFPLNDRERTCVVERVGVSAEELAAVPADELRPVVEDCVQLESFGPALTAGLVEDFPGAYSAEELECIEEQYAALSTDDLSALTAAGLNPDDETVAEAGAEALATMFGACGTVPPADL